MSRELEGEERVVEAQQTASEEGATTPVEGQTLGSVTAEKVHIQVGGAGLVAVDDHAAAAHGTNVTIYKSGALLMTAKHAEVQNGPVVLLAAREVSGDVQVLFDVRAAVLFGLVAGLVVGLLKRLVPRKG